MKFVLADTEKHARELAEQNFIFNSRRELDFILNKHRDSGLRVFKIYDGCLGIRVFCASQIKPKELPLKRDELDTKALEWLKEKGFR